MTEYPSNWVTKDTTIGGRPVSLTLLQLEREVTFLTRLDLALAMLTAPACIVLLGRTRKVTIHKRGKR